MQQKSFSAILHRVYSLWIFQPLKQHAANLCQVAILYRTTTLTLKKNKKLEGLTITKLNDSNSEANVFLVPKLHRHQSLLISGTLLNLYSYTRNRKSNIPAAKDVLCTGTIWYWTCCSPATPQTQARQFSLPLIPPRNTLCHRYGQYFKVLEVFSHGKAKQIQAIIPDITEVPKVWITHERVRAKGTYRAQDQTSPLRLYQATPEQGLMSPVLKSCNTAKDEQGNLQTHQCAHGKKQEAQAPARTHCTAGTENSS